MHRLPLTIGQVQVKDSELISYETESGREILYKREWLHFILLIIFFLLIVVTRRA